ncbi:MAG: hypothetical protein K6G52_02915 [Treponemataceae bacterium]|nr:hypothetical protein [Treponemataceae bacterium]
MKKIKLIAAALICVTSLSMVAVAKTKDVSNPIVIIDSKGAQWGAKTPKWVNSVLKHENQKKLNKALGVKGKKVWVVTSNGKNIQFLEMWADSVDGPSQVAASIERSVVNYVKATVSGDEDDLKSEIERFTTSFTALTMAGLEEEDSWWIKTRQLKPGLKKAEDEKDYIETYQYMVVFTMDEDNYKKQVKIALDNIKETKVDKEGLLETLMESTMAESAAK